MLSQETNQDWEEALLAVKRLRGKAVPPETYQALLNVLNENLAESRAEMDRRIEKLNQQIKDYKEGR